MQVIYICSPLRATATRTLAEHLTDAERFARWSLRTHSVYPVAPHLELTRYLDDTVPADRELGMALAIEILHRCEEVWVLVGVSGISEGMWTEIGLAQSLGISVRIFEPDCWEAPRSYWTVPAERTWDYLRVRREQAGEVPAA